jgi:hypothetical protein
MKHPRDPVELVRSANPVPDHDQLPDASSPEATFEEIMIMKTQTPTTSVVRKRPRRVAMIAAALIALTTTAAAAVALSSGGNLDEPAFAGDNWELTVGEAANGDTNTFKVCHKFVPADEPETEANGLGTAGCSDWPSATQPDAIIIDAVVAIHNDVSAVVFVDLGTVPVDVVAAVFEDGSRMEVDPFVMPQSGKQFAVVELPGGTAAVSLEAIGSDGAILDTDEVLEGN